MRFSDQNYNVYGAFINAPFSGISTTQCRSLQVAGSVNRDPFEGEGREIYQQPKKQLKVQYIGIFEEIDSFY